MAPTARAGPRRQLDALVEPVLDEAAVGQALDGRGHRAGADVEPLGEVAGVRGLVALRQPVDRLERLPLGLRELRSSSISAEEWILALRKVKAGLAGPSSAAFTRDVRPRVLERDPQEHPLLPSISR